MVRTDSKKNLVGSVTDLKAARIEKNLAMLTELVNSSPETKARTMDYIMAKSNAELQAAYKARAKQNKKQLNYFISLEAHNALSTLATDTGKPKIEILESLLLGKNQQSNDSELQKQFEILQIKNENLTRDIGSMNQRNSELSDELRSAKASLANQKPMINILQKQVDNLTNSLQALKAENIKLLNPTSKPITQPEPLNLKPERVFKYDYLGFERLVAWLSNDTRIFYKDAGKRWQLFVDANRGHFSEREGRFYFGNTEIYPVENFKGKLPKTLIMR